jgi:imidazolonepropionase
MTTPAVSLWRRGRLFTLAGDSGWGEVEGGTLLVRDGRIAWVGPDDTLPAGLAAEAVEEHDLQGLCVTPGLVDCHTHLVYGGDRAGEFERRLQGISYEQIAREGGGIRATVAATRAADEHTLLQAATRRAQALMDDGATTVEVKSGYGLSAEHEARCLRVARRLSEALPLDVATTCLAAHALPPEFDGRPDDYIDAVCSWLPALQAEGLVDAVDAFCERIAFTPAQTRRLFETARRLGLPVKLHAEQLSDSGGATLAAEFGALSSDHLEHLSEAGVQAMARAGSVAVLLPGAYYFLRDTTLPPVAALRAQGVPIAVATDHNPGSSPALSLTLMIHMACSLFRLTPEESVRGATVNGARALGLADRGRLGVGQRADFALWDLTHPRELAYWFGRSACRASVHAGRLRRPLLSEPR